MIPHMPRPLRNLAARWTPALALAAMLLVQPLALPLHMQAAHATQQAAHECDSHPAPAAPETPAKHSDSRSCDVCQWLLQSGGHLLIESPTPPILVSLSMPGVAVVDPTPARISHHRHASPRAPPSIA